MRKLILIAVVSLLATQAHAGGPRSLSLAASNANHQATEQPAIVAPQTVQAPAPTQPATTTVQTATATPTSTTPAASVSTAAAPAVTTPAQSTVAPAASASEPTKPKHRNPSVEARVIRELHRHAIYW